MDPCTSPASQEGCPCSNEDRFNADLYLPWPLNRLTGKPFAITNATSSVFLLGFLLAAFLAAGQLGPERSADPTGIVLFLILTMSCTVLRIGLFARDTATRLLLTTIMSDEGARALIAGVVRGRGTGSVALGRQGGLGHRRSSGFLGVPGHRRSVGGLPIGGRWSEAGKAGGMKPIAGRMSSWRETSRAFPGSAKVGPAPATVEGVTGKDVSQASGETYPRTQTMVRRESLLDDVVRGSERGGMSAPRIIPRNHTVTVIFSDIVGFTSISSTRSPVTVFRTLHEYFNKLDRLLPAYGVFKYQTVGDAYVAVANYHGECPESQAQRALEFGRAMVKVASSCMVGSDGDLSQGSDDEGDSGRWPCREPLRIRVGLHSGPLHACVLGSERPALTLIGDTLNTGSRMESSSRPGHLRMSATTFNMLPTAMQELGCLEREVIRPKGKGEMETFIFDCEDDAKWTHLCGAAADESVRVPSEPRPAGARPEVPLGESLA